MFQETFATELDKLLSTCAISSDLHDEEGKVKFIVQVCEELHSLLFKAARTAEKSLGIYTTNGLLRGSFVRCWFSSEIMNIVAEIKYLVWSGIPSDSDQIRCPKPDLRRLQRLVLYNRLVFTIRKKSEALRLDRVLNHNKPSFWRKILNSRKLRKEKGYYRQKTNLVHRILLIFIVIFFLIDPSSLENKVIEEKVQNYLSSLLNLSSDSTFSIDCIVRYIEKLKNNKSPGFDDISNEFLKSGTNTQLAVILGDLFNFMLSTGFAQIGDSFLCLGVGSIKDSKVGLICYF